MSEAGAQASIAGLGLKRWLAGAGVAALGLLGWLSSDEIAEMIEIHSPRPRQALRVLLATPEQQATLDSALARGMIEDGRRGYGLVSISGDPDSAFLVTPEGESLALGKILQVVDLHHQARLAREMGMAILRGDTPRWPEIEARFSLIYGDTLILNDRSLMQGAVRRALNSADVYALLIQADERTPYEQIRRLQREALEAGIGLLILGLPPHVYARFDGTGLLGTAMPDSLLQRYIIPAARQAHERGRLTAPLFVLTPQPSTAPRKKAVLAVDQHANMEFAGETVTFATMQEKMRNKAPDGVLRVEADGRVPLGVVLQAVDVAAKAGIRFVEDL